MSKKELRPKKVKNLDTSVSLVTITTTTDYGTKKIEVDIPEDRDKELAFARSLHSDSYPPMSRETLIRFFGIETVEFIENNGFDPDFGFLQLAEFLKNKQTPEIHKNVDDSIIHDASDSDAYSASMLLSTFFKKFKDKNIDDRDGKKWTTRTAFDYQDTLHIYLEHIGGDLPLNKITPRMHLDFQEVLRKLPANRNKKEKYTGIKIKELIKMDIDKSDLMATNTINNHTRRINAITAEMKNQMVATLPILKIIKTNQNSTTRLRKGRLPYTKKDIEAILQHNIFKNKTYKQQYQFWLVPIAIYTGCRLREICQLEHQDIQKCPKTNIWYFDINDKPSPAAQKTKVDKRLKNTTSIRKIPIHQHLIELGFLDFFNYSRNLNQDPYLFRIKPNPQGDCSSSVSKWFQRINNSITLDRSNGNKLFHCFRHTFINSLTELRHREMDINDLAGHSQQTTSTKIYKSIDLEILYDVINTLDFRNELSSIDPWNEKLIP